MLNVKTIIVSKMASHCAGTVQMREETESGIRKWEEMWFKTTAEDGQREGAAVTCDGRLFHRRAAV